MPSECVFDHLSNNARRFHEFHRKWHIAYFHVERDHHAAEAVQFAKAGNGHAWWQSVAAFKFAREIERQMLETGERI